MVGRSRVQFGHQMVYNLAMPTLRQPKHRIVKEPTKVGLLAHWKSGNVRVGDMFITNKPLKPVPPKPGEALRKFGLLVGSSKGKATVKKGSLAIYTGPVRFVERNRYGNVQALQHTFVFPWGRFVVVELDALDPAA